MSSQTKHRIILLQPGANAQFTRRVLGIARAFGCAMDVYTQIEQLNPLPQADFVSLIAPRDALPKSFDRTPYSRIIAFQEQAHAGQSYLEHDRTWHCMGNPVTSAHATVVVQNLIQSQNCMTGIQVGWSGSHISVECRTKDQIRELVAPLKRLRLQSTPSIKGFIEVLHAVQIATSGNSHSEMQLWCDGKSLSFNWQVNQVSLGSQDLLSILQKSNDALYIIAITKTELSEDLTIQGRLLIGREITPSSSLVLIGNDLRTAETSTRAASEEKEADIIALSPPLGRSA